MKISSYLRQIINDVFKWRLKYAKNKAKDISYVSCSEGIFKITIEKEEQNQ